jgi:hypothetical protein
MNTAELLVARRDVSLTECEAIADALTKAGTGMTILELEFVTGIRSSTICARLRELRLADRVERAPFKRACSVNGITKLIWQLSPPKRPAPEVGTTADLFGGAA